LNLERPKKEILRKFKAKVWFLLGLYSRVGKQFANTLGSEIIESLGHGKRFGKRVEIRCALGERVLKLISCKSFVSLCQKKNSLIVKWRDLSPPDVGHCWTKLGKQILGVLFSILYSHYLVVLWFDCGFAFHLVARLDLDLLLLLVTVWLLVAIDICSTHLSFTGVSFESRIHNNYLS